MARNEITLGATGAAQGRVVFLNGKLRMQYGTAPAWTDYITIDSAGLISLPAATAQASGVRFGTSATPVLWGPDVDSLRIKGNSATNLGLGSGTSYVGANSGDTEAFFYSNGTLRLRPANGSALIVTQEGNGQAFNVKTLTELTTIAAAANTDTAIQIPINAVVFAVSVRVTVVIPTAATFTVTGTTSGTTFNTAAVDVAADTTNVGTAACPYKNGAAQTIRITPSATPAANTGRVRVTIHYYDITVPTS